VEDDEQIDSPKKLTKPKDYFTLNPFKDLYKSSPLVQTALEFGKNNIPLSVVGMILNYAGNHLLHYIYQIMHKKCFHPMTRVCSITLMPNGDIVTQAVK
jgi:hypothetical protein